MRRTAGASLRHDNGSPTDRTDFDGSTTTAFSTDFTDCSGSTKLQQPLPRIAQIWH
jgi:hypothetical protein